MAFLPAQPYKLVLGDESRSNLNVPKSPVRSMSDMEYAMSGDAVQVTNDMYYLLGRLTYLLRRIPGDERFETAAVSLRVEVGEIRARLAVIDGWLINARTPR
jgi:hypothetical protein